MGDYKNTTDTEALVATYEQALGVAKATARVINAYNKWLDNPIPNAKGFDFMNADDRSRYIEATDKNYKALGEVKRAIVSWCKVNGFRFDSLVTVSITSYIRLYNKYQTVYEYQLNY